MSAVADTQSAEQIALRSGSSFLVSFSALEPERRSALTAVYAFCRVVDDAVDQATNADQARANLRFWRDEMERAYAGRPDTAIGRSLQAAISRFDVRRPHLEAVCDGVAMDLAPPDYRTLEDLEGYCYKVASAVGLACLPVFGASGDAADEYAVQLGLALQLTNVLRDICADAAAGRVYLPRQMLGEAGVDIGWLTGEGPAAVYRRDGPIGSVIARLVAAAEEHFARAARALPAEHRAALLAPEIMAAVYRELLRRVARRGGDLRRLRRPRVPRWQRLVLAWRVRARCRG